MGFSDVMRKTVMITVVCAGFETNRRPLFGRSSCIGVSSHGVRYRVSCLQDVHSDKRNKLRASKSPTSVTLLRFIGIIA